MAAMCGAGVGQHTGGPCVLALLMAASLMRGPGAREQELDTHRHQGLRLLLTKCQHEQTDKQWDAGAHTHIDTHMLRTGFTFQTQVTIIDPAGNKASVTQRQEDDTSIFSVTVQM